MTVPISDPRELHRAFADAFNRRDVEELLTLYEPDAALVPQPGRQVTGLAAIRTALEEFLTLKATLTVETHSVVVTPDVALLQGEWTLRGTAPDGSAIKMGGPEAEVLRRQPDGSWRCIIDNPMG